MMLAPPHQADEVAVWHQVWTRRDDPAVSLRRLGWLLFPQPCLAQALQMQLVHPFVAKTVLAEESE